MYAFSDQEQAHDIPDEPMSTQSAPADPAASLRAAALLTLKSKRRKLGTVSEAAPPVASRSDSTSIQLDYGQEEPSAGVSSPASSAPVAPAPESDDGEEGQAREEGEISDSETTATPSVPSKLEPRPSDKALGKRPISPNPMPPPPQIPPSPVKMEPPTTPVLAEPVPAHVPMTVSTSIVIDADHVRPGLAMSQAQYDTAKDIVLDLLGWGVPPEYLVNCGLSRELVYYVFVELNLRLPPNLDITGIPPYPPVAPVPWVGDSHLSSPQKVPVPDSPSHSQALSAAAPAFVPGPSSPSLLDMEAQRRQELLARKAVLASRKLKQQASISVSTGDTSPSTPLAVPVMPLIAERKDAEMAIDEDPTQTVDDFLNSIEPTGENGGAVTIAPPRRAKFDDMDIDEPIPGLTASEDAVASRLALLPSASSTRSMSISDVASPTSAVPSTESSTPNDLFRAQSVDSVVTLNGATLELDSPSFLTSNQSRAGSSGPGQGALPPPARRGTKRPVAADFVDMEPGPSRTHSSNGYYKPGYYHRRKLGTFAGVSSARRCVIDVSDSEDEVEEGYIEESPEDLQPSSLSRNGSMRGAPLSGSDAMLPPSRLSPGTSATTGKSPAALLEKEEEIRRMRELIHQREQNRLRKLAAISAPSTPMDGSLSTPYSVKQEEDDVAAQLNGFGGRATYSPHLPNDILSDHSHRFFPRAQAQPPISISLPESTSGSTSSTGTPIDVISNALEHSTTGDKVLTSEARHEQAVHRSQRTTPSYEQQFSNLTLGQVGVVDSNGETSAQNQAGAGDIRMQEEAQGEPAAHFATYSSPLDSYPLLRSHSHYVSVSSQSSFTSHQHPTSATVSSSSPLAAIDLNALKSARAKHMLTDPARRICQYEVPGGGECRDRDCEDIHLSRTSLDEPSDQETAQYLHAVLSIGSRYGVQDLKDALEDTRRRHPTKNYEDRVSQALVSLGVR